MRALAADRDRFQALYKRALQDLEAGGEVAEETRAAPAYAALERQKEALAGQLKSVLGFLSDAHSRVDELTTAMKERESESAELKEHVGQLRSLLTQVRANVRPSPDAVTDASPVVLCLCARACFMTLTLILQVDSMRDALQEDLAAERESKAESAVELDLAHVRKELQKRTAELAAERKHVRDGDAERDALQAELDSVDERLHSLESRHEALNLAHEDLARVRVREQHRLEETAEELRAAEHTVALAEQQLQFTSREQQASGDRLSHTADELQRANQDMQVLSGELQRAQERVVVLSTEVDELKSHAHASASHVAGAAEAIRARERAAAGLSQNLQSLNEDHARLTLFVKQIEVERDVARSRVAPLQDALSGAQERMAALEEDRTQMLFDLQNGAARSDELGRILASLHQKVRFSPAGVEPSELAATLSRAQELTVPYERTADMAHHDSVMLAQENASLNKALTSAQLRASQAEGERKGALQRLQALERRVLATGGLGLGAVTDSSHDHSDRGTASSAAGSYSSFQTGTLRGARVETTEGQSAVLQRLLSKAERDREDAQRRASRMQLSIEERDTALRLLDSEHDKLKKYVLKYEAELLRLEAESKRAKKGPPQTPLVGRNESEDSSDW